METGVDSEGQCGPDFRCHLTMRVPRGTAHVMKKLLSPLLQWVDPSFQMVRVAESQEQSTSAREGQAVPRYQGDGGGLSVPALSVMLFLQERGDLSAAMMGKAFKRSPWKLHHKIELQSRRTPEFKVGEQAFYSLSRQFPLWAVCPVHAGHEHLRLNLFVRNYRAMVEFYRLVADSEMESSKAGFCIFPLHSCKPLSVQLALKHSPGLRPYPTPEAFLTFQVRDAHSLLQFLKTDAVEVAPRRFLVQDPDGNDVVLHDVTPRLADMVTSVSDVRIKRDGVTCDVTSVRSNCESHDSGRFSDSDLCGSELDHGQNCPLHGRGGVPATLRTCDIIGQRSCGAMGQRSCDVTGQRSCNVTGQRSRDAMGQRSRDVMRQRSRDTMGLRSCGVVGCDGMGTFQSLWDCHQQLSDAIANLTTSDDTCATSSGLSSMSGEEASNCSGACGPLSECRPGSESQPNPHQYLRNKKYYTPPVYL